MLASKSYPPRRPADSTQPLTNDKLRDKVEKLQELFPNWSQEDLQSVLTETVGDVELAVARISEGHAEQWGSVTRKKDKRTPQSSQTTSSSTPRGDRDRPGDIRGGRGGRGGRGRGGAGRGASRGSHVSNHHREPGTTPNGIAASAVETVQSSNEVRLDTSTSLISASNDGGTEAKANGLLSGTHEAGSTKTGVNESHDAGQERWTAPTEQPAASSSSVAGWVGDATTEATPVPAWVPETGTAESWSSTSAQNGTSEIAKAKIQAKTSKIPSGTKLSWAQIARVQDKPKPVAPPPTQPLPPPPLPTEPVLNPVTEEVPLPQDQQHGWEEPTTVQPPTWDDEPSPLPPQAPDSLTPSHDGWITGDSVSSPAAPPETWDSSVGHSTSRPETVTQESTWSQTQPEESPSVPSPQPMTSPATSLAPTSSTSNPATSTAPTSKPSTPSVTHGSVASVRPPNAHKTGARYPKSDQAVVIPAFAGSIGSSSEKLGMQFGSLSIGGEDSSDGIAKVETTQPTSSPSEPPQQPSQVHQGQIPPQSQAPDNISSSVVPAPTQNFFQQQPQPTPSAPPPTHQIQSPPQASQLHPQPTPSGPPFGTHQPPPALTHQHHQQLTQPHHQQQPQHSYVQQQQHPLHAHFEGPPAPQQQQPQHATGPQPGSYFRQPETPYYHNPTPPQSAPPEHQGAYGTTFSPLGVNAGAHAHAQGLGGQAQGTHLGGFGAAGPGEYGYGDGQRGFYDYAPPGGFSNRLVHDEPKGALPMSQGNQPTSSLASAGGQTQASGGPQGSSGPPAGQQGQQQGYPAPMPYYYPPYYPQNSYPTYPNPSYGQAYMHKYPAVYAHQTPVGPGSGPPPAGKGPSATGPYGASASQSHLYHGQGGFDDPTASYQHHQGSANLGSTDYQKQPPHHQQQQQPLYGAQATQGLQSFLGMQQTPGSGQGVVGPGGQQRSGTSPEAAYKPYGPPGGASDKTGVGLGTQPGPQGRTAGVQQSQQQAGGAGSFYPGGRYGGGAGGPQQGQQQNQGYPQGGDQGQFYPYQPRHQGGYWQ